MKLASVGRHKCTVKTAHLGYCQESRRLGGVWVWRRGEPTQSEINNSTLIQHRPVITVRPPVTEAFHSKQLQRVGGRLLLSAFIRHFGISIFRSVLHNICISFWRPEKSEPRNTTCCYSYTVIGHKMCCDLHLSHNNSQTQTSQKYH